MSDTILGTVPDENSVRDAIHIAIYPLIAGELLKPGQQIGIVDNKGFLNAPKKIGIVDPFLSHNVKKGTRFWLVLFQKSVTGMRHHWEHPDFKNEEIPEIDEKNSSVIWMENYASNINISYDELIEGMNNYIKCGQSFSKGGKFEGINKIPEKFWDHYYNITGKHGHGHPFSCSC